MDELKPDEVRQIIEEVETWYKETLFLDTIHVRYLRFFCDLPTEAYEMVLENGATELFFRNDEGQLQPSARLTYAGESLQE